MPVSRRIRGNNIAVHSEDASFRGEGRTVASALRKALAFLRVRGAALSVFLVRDASMARLNREYRRKSTPTTVLSFPARRGFPHPEIPRSATRYLGEIYLAPRVIRARDERATRMAIHGLLHLLGYAHARRRDRMVMEAREAEIAAKLGASRRSPSARP